MKINIDFGFVLLITLILVITILTIVGMRAGDFHLIDKFSIGYVFGGWMMAGIIALKKGIIIDTKKWKMEEYGW